MSVARVVADSLIGRRRRRDAIGWQSRLTNGTSSRSYGLPILSTAARGDPQSTRCTPDPEILIKGTS